MDGWVTVATYPSRALAEMMQELLENEGIPAVLVIDDGGGLRPELAYALGVKLRVAPQDQTKARELLEARGGAGDEEE